MDPALRVMLDACAVSGTLGSKSRWGECLVLLEGSPSRRVAPRMSRAYSPSMSLRAVCVL